MLSIRSYCGLVHSQDDFLRDSNQPSVLLDEPIPQLRPAGTFASAITLLDEAPRENVLSITQHRLTRLIDMNPGLSRAEIIGLQLCSEKGDASNRYYVMLQLRRKGENVIMWLRLEQTWKRQRLSLLKKSSESVKRTVRTFGQGSTTQIERLAVRLASHL